MTKFNIIRKDSTFSTNDDAKLAGPFEVIAAREQLAGRGRIGHAWHAAPGESLAFSAVLPAPEDPLHASSLPLVAGLAVCEALGGECRIKWPNDIFHGGRKLGGILCERTGDNIVAGIGINVNETAFPAEIAARATSLKLATGRKQDIDAVLGRILDRLGRDYEEWLAHGFARFTGRYAARDFLIGRRISVFQTDGDPSPVSGVYGGVRADGSILVGDLPVYAGEVHVEVLQPTAENSEIFQIDKSAAILV